MADRFRSRQWIDAEPGQAVVLIAAAAVALAGMLALVVDTGHLYVEQRRMQNAADAAAMAAAQNWLSASSQLSVGQAVVDARGFATYNGYTTSVSAGNGAWDPAVDHGVQVNIPPATGPYTTSTQYVEVLISQPVSTFFVGIFSVASVQVSARAVARGTIGSFDASLVALSRDSAAISTSGSSSTNVFGNLYTAGGVSCGSGNIQVYQGAAYAAGTFGPSCVAGQLNAEGGLFAGAPSLYDPKWSSFENLAPPGPTGNWTSSGQTKDAEGYYHIPAGTYNSITVRASDFVKFDGGVYHLMGEGDTPALTIQGAVATVSPLQFVLESGATHFEAQASGSLSSGPQYNNILVYSKRSDGGNAIQISGGANLVYNGTIYAPGANAAIAGNSSAVINGQVVASTITLSGSSGTAINWNEGEAPLVSAPKLVE